MIHTLTAFDPFGSEGQKTRVIGLEADQWEKLQKASDERRVMRLLLVKEVVTNPTLVFRDWKREGLENGVCYVGRPEHDFRSKTIEVPPPPGMVFCVFVTPSGKISDWRWEVAEDKDNPVYPEGWRDRFGSVVWSAKPT